MSYRSIHIKDIISREGFVMMKGYGTLPVDMGISLDSLPYIIILVIVIAGIAVILIRKRRTNTDD